MPEGESELKGKTLRVYWFILRMRKSVRVAEIQRGLGFSTPSLVQYHLGKLIHAGLVAEDGNGYSIKKYEVQNFFVLRRTLVPFQAAYIGFFSTTLVAMSTLLVMMGFTNINSFGFLAIVVNIVALIVSIYETIRTWRSLP